jgi:uncharacterized protein DUF3667
VAVMTIPTDAPIVAPRPDADAVRPVAERCVSCGVELTTPFCAHCGEQRASDRRYTLLHFAQEAIEHIAQFDGTVWRTVKTLVAKPGELTAAYMRGERLRYMKPLQLFVLVSVMYFFVAGSLNIRTFDTPLRLQMQSFSGPAKKIEARLAERHLTLEQYAVTFDATSTSQAKSLVIVMVPAFALVLALLEVRKRRYALQQLVFALHTYTLLLLAVMAADIVIAPVLRAMRRASSTVISRYADGIMSTIIVVVLFAWLLFALRRAYRDGWIGATAKAVVLLFAMGFFVAAYRMLLFYTTYWAT